MYYTSWLKANLYIEKLNEAKILQPENLKFYYNLIRLNPDYINDKIVNLIKF